MRSGRDCGHDILMPGHRLSREAVADIEAIGDYGIETFGLTQALKYHVGLESRFDLLSEFPRIGSPCYDLRPGLYRWLYKSHAIFLYDQLRPNLHRPHSPRARGFRQAFLTSKPRQLGLHGKDFPDEIRAAITRSKPDRGHYP